MLIPRRFRASVARPDALCLALAFSLLLVAVLALLPVPARAAVKLEAGVQVPASNTAEAGNVAYGGTTWNVVGTPTEGINAGAGAQAYTLLSVGAVAELPFRTGNSSSLLTQLLSVFTGSRACEGWYYEQNPSGMADWAQPNEYAGSTVQRYLESYAQGSNLSDAERSAAVPRSLDGLANQSLWLLSQDEEMTLAGELVACGTAHDGAWWTRTASTNSIHAGTKAVLADPYGPIDSCDYVHETWNVRPAVTVSLANVLMTSSAKAGEGKASVKVGSTLQTIGAIGELGSSTTVKYTLVSDDLALAVEAKTNGYRDESGKVQPATITYKGATAGATVSCLVANASGELVKYGKLANISASSGTVGFTVMNSWESSELPNGSYTLELFEELASATDSSGNETGSDACSRPITISFKVVDNGVVVFDDAESLHVSYQATGEAPEGWVCPTDETAYKAGDGVKLAAVGDYEGFEFDGWYLDEVKHEPGSMLTLGDGDVTLVGAWKHVAASEYTVTFDRATGGEGDVSTQKVAAGEHVAEPEDPVRDGYTFAGWYLGGSLYDFDTPVTANITLVAHWTQIPSYTVSFDTAGGSAVASQVVKAGSTASCPAAPTFDGREFLGWYLNGVEYDFSAPVTADIVLRARWENVPTYTLSYELAAGSACPDGWTVPSDPGSYAPGDSAVLAEVEGAYDHAGFSFLGWTVNGVLYHPGSTFTVPELAQGQTEVKISGWWVKATSASFSVAGEDGDLGGALNVSSMGGLGSEGLSTYTQAVQFAYDATEAEAAQLASLGFDYDEAKGVWQHKGLTVTAVPEKGYSFTGWYDLRAAGEERLVSNEAEITVTKDAQTGYWADIDYAACFSPKVYTVSYDSAGGSAVASRQAKWREADLVRAAPVREGYVFAGWYYGDGDAATRASSATTCADIAGGDDTATELVLTAHWEPMSFTVSFDAAGGSAVESQAVCYGEAAAEPAVPTREGYTFLGWNLGEDAYDFSRPVTGDLTLVAQWKKADEPVTPDPPGPVTPVTPDPETPDPETPVTPSPQPTTDDPVTPQPASPATPGGSGGSSGGGSGSKLVRTGDATSAVAAAFIAATGIVLLVAHFVVRRTHD